MIAVMGATGCIGRHLLPLLKGKVVAGYRSKPGPHYSHVKWKKISDPDFLKGCDVLFYLIHSLGKKNFEELDKQLAIDTAKRAKDAGIKKIIYLGGIVHKKHSSPHLQSRAITGKFLGSTGIPVAEVRASIILARESSSFDICYRLATRLPIMITPKWLRRKCAPIGINDVVVFLESISHKKITKHTIYDIGSTVMEYRELLQEISMALHGKKRHIYTVPFVALKPSSIWVSMVTWYPYNLVQHLVGSLIIDTIPQPNMFKKIVGKDPMPVRIVVKNIIKEIKN
jgi:uncharacterized protein YbjT (DUF2867 family)